MSRRHLIDPEVAVPLDGLLEALPGGFNAIPDIVQRRAAVTAMLAGIEVPDNPNVVKEDRVIPGPDGAPDISVRIYRPLDADRHPAGHLLHPRRRDDRSATSRARTRPPTMICDEVGAVVVSVEYRLAPENPHPAPVEDCYAGLAWIAEHAAELGIDPDRLAIYGGSAGGGLAIATALMARDRGGPALSAS